MRYTVMAPPKVVKNHRVTSLTIMVAPAAASLGTPMARYKVVMSMSISPRPPGRNVGSNCNMTMTEKMVKKKYDPIAKKHVEFREGKIK